MTLRPGSTKKAKKTEKSVQENAKEEAKQEQKKQKTPIYGVTAISSLLGFSPRTAHRWRYAFKDFPVTSDGVSCVWLSTVEDLNEWKEKHADLFILHKERMDVVAPKRIRRW